MYYNWKNGINETELNNIAQNMLNGEIVVMPTETVYGIGADLYNEEAIKKIFSGVFRFHLRHIKFLRRLIIFPTTAAMPPIHA